MKIYSPEGNFNINWKPAKYKHDKWNAEQN